MTTGRLTWAQVLRVQFGDGAPWVTLDLDDTDQLAVMAIQRALSQRGTRRRVLAGEREVIVSILSSRVPECPERVPGRAVHVPGRAGRGGRMGA